MNINSFVNNARNTFLTEAQIKQKKDIDRGCDIAKIVCISAAVCVVALAALAISSGSLLGIIGGVIGAGLGLCVAYDGYQFSANLQELNSDALVELTVSLSKKKLTGQLSKGMIFSRLFVEDFVENLAKRSRG